MRTRRSPPQGPAVASPGERACGSVRAQRGSYLHLLFGVFEWRFEGTGGALEDLILGPASLTSRFGSEGKAGQRKALKSAELVGEEKVNI